MKKRYLLLPCRLRSGIVHINWTAGESFRLCGLRGEDADYKTNRRGSSKTAAPIYFVAGYSRNRNDGSFK
jgi:hypothetical protein